MFSEYVCEEGLIGKHKKLSNRPMQASSPLSSRFFYARSKMQELIEVKQATFGNAVSARELYIGLGLNISSWGRWWQANIINNRYFSQSIDYDELCIVPSSSQPNPPKDFAISIEFAKHLAMQSQTREAHDYRNYFIECEKKVASKSLPSNYIEALQALVVSETQKEELRLISAGQASQIEHQTKVIKQKDQYVIASNEASIKAGEILVREFCKSVDIIDIGEKQFYQWMRDKGIVSENNEPYGQYVKAGYFTYKPTEEMHGGKYRYTMRITPRGKVWLAAKYLLHIDTQDA